MIRLAGSLTVVVLEDFVHPEQPSYTSYTPYTLTHNQGKHPVLVHFWFTTGGLTKNLFEGGGPRNDYIDHINLNQITAYLVRFGNGDSSYTITPKLYFN